ncbi:MAG: hypothetical protein H6630_00175 [Arcobacter sp.]|nr:hypothetical protein [Arcobacter sp.]
MFLGLIFLLNINILANKTDIYEEYWQKLKDRADKMYKGIDLDVDLSVGQYIDDSGDETKGQVKFTIPLFSKAEKREKEATREAFLKEGAEYIEQIKKIDVSVGILESKRKLLRTLLMEEGVKSVESYYANEEAIQYKKAERETAIRKLEAMLR